MQTVAEFDSAGTAAASADEGLPRRPPPNVRPFASAAEARAALFRSPLDHDLMVLHKRDAARVASAAAAVTDASAAALLSLEGSRDFCAEQHALYATHATEAEAEADEAETLQAIAMSEGDDDAAALAGRVAELAAVARKQREAVAEASADLRKAEAAVAAERTRLGLAPGTPAPLLGAGASAAADEAEAAAHVLSAPGPASELTAFLAALASLAASAALGAHTPQPWLRRRAALLSLCEALCAPARSAPLSALWRWWPYTWLPARLRAAPREMLALAWGCGDAGAAAASSPSVDGSPAAALLFALADAGLEPLGVGPIAQGAGLGMSLLQTHAARARRDDALNEPAGLGQAHLRAAAATASPAPHLFPGLMREVAAALVASPDALRGAGAVVDAVLGGAYAAGLRDLRCGRSVGLLSPAADGSDADGSLCGVAVVALCSWSTGEAPHPPARGPGAPRSLLLVPSPATEAALSLEAVGPLRADCDLARVRSVPSDAVVASTASSWLPAAIIDGSAGAGDGTGARALATALGRLPRDLREAAARAALLSHPVVRVRWSGGESLAVVEALPSQASAEGASAPQLALPWGPLVAAAVGRSQDVGRIATSADAIRILCQSAGPAQTVLLEQLAPSLLPLMSGFLQPAPGAPSLAAADAEAVKRLVVALGGERLIAVDALAQNAPAASSSRLIDAILQPARTVAGERTPELILQRVVPVTRAVVVSSAYAVMRELPLSILLSGLGTTAKDEDALLLICVIVERVASSGCAGLGTEAGCSLAPFFALLMRLAPRIADASFAEDTVAFGMYTLQALAGWADGLRVLAASHAQDLFALLNALPEAPSPLHADICHVIALVADTEVGRSAIVASGDAPFSVLRVVGRKAAGLSRAAAEQSTLARAAALRVLTILAGDAAARESLGFMTDAVRE